VAFALAVAFAFALALAVALAFSFASNQTNLVILSAAKDPLLSLPLHLPLFLPQTKQILSS
jgi:hypothetical protein